MSSRAGDDELSPEPRADELDRAWGEGVRKSQRVGSSADPDADLDDDERFLREVPPHHGD